MNIEIVDWRKYNPKRDQRTYSWLRLNNDLCSGSEFSDYNANEILVWISILSEASKKNEESIKVKLSFLKKCARTNLKTVKDTIERLVKDNYIRVVDDEEKENHDRARSQRSSDTTPTNERTDVTNERTNDTAISESGFIELFNSILGGHGKVRMFPGFNLPRKALENFILTSGFPQFKTYEQWKEILTKDVLRSEFLMGNSDTNFVVTVDWLADQDNAFKVIGGKYPNKGDTGSTASFSLDAMKLEEGA